MAIFSGSKGSIAVGLPVRTLQKAQDRVQISPKIITVTCFSDQHSPIFGQAASSQTVFNPNLETVPRLYSSVRKGARYKGSLEVLELVKRYDPEIFTKSGIMVGLGENFDEVLAVMSDMRESGGDFITIGQYLQPTPKHAAVERFVTPEEFRDYENVAREKGFLMVSASPLTRSSYHADRDFERLKIARQKLMVT